MKHMVDKVTALQDELNAYKNKTMVLSQEADAEIQGLQQQLSEYKKTSPANKDSHFHGVFRGQHH